MAEWSKAPPWKGGRGESSSWVQIPPSPPKLGIDVRLKVMDTNKKIAIIAGILFLTSTFAFAIGSAFIESFITGENLSKTSLTIGVLLEVYCGVAVAGIGVVMFPILRIFNKRLALGYAIFRSLDLVFILANGIFLLSLFKLLQNYDLMIYTMNGIGGLMFAYVLYQSKLIPQSLSTLGFVGYAVLLIGVPLELFGYVNMDVGAGLTFYAPGGLFELILPIWLFVKGFNASAVASAIAEADEL